MATEKCPTCGVFLWTWKLPHVCPPAWKVRVPEWVNDDCLTVYAIDAEAAAEKAVEDRDERGELAQNESSVEVMVLVGERWVIYNVTASYSVDYSAELKEDTDG